MKKTRSVALNILAVTLMLSVTVLAQGGPAISWSALTGGGGSGAIGGVSLDSAIGQWAASVSGQLSAGFLPGAAPAPVARPLQYLPLVMRQ